MTFNVGLSDLNVSWLVGAPRQTSKWRRRKGEMARHVRGCYSPLVGR